MPVEDEKPVLRIHLPRQELDECSKNTNGEHNINNDKRYVSPRGVEPRRRRSSRTPRYRTGKYTVS